MVHPPAAAGPTGVASSATDSAETAPVPEAVPADGLLRRLGTGTINYGLGSVLLQLIGFLLIPLYTAYLTPAEYGIIDLSATLLPALVLLMRFGVPGAVARLYYDAPEGPTLRDFVTTVHRFLLASSLAIGAGVLLLFRVVGEHLVPGLPFYPFVVLTVVIAIASGNSELQRRLLQAREQSRHAAALSIASGGIAIVLAVTFIAWFRWGAAGMVLANAITAVLFFLQAQHYLRADLGGRFRRPMLGTALNYGLKILPSHLLTAVTPVIVRSMLSGSTGAAAVGFIGLASRFATPLAVAYGAFSIAYPPIYFATRKAGAADGPRRLADAAQVAWYLGLLGFLGLSLLGPPVIRLITPLEFHPAAPLVPLLAAGFLANILYAIVAPELFYGKQTILVPIVSAFGALTTVGVVALTVRSHGPVAVAWATVAGATVTAVVAAFLSQRLARLPYRWLDLIRLTAAAAAALLAGLALTGDARSQLGAGTAIIAAFPLVLWALGDRTLGMALRELRTRR